MKSAVMRCRLCTLGLVTLASATLLGCGALGGGLSKPGAADASSVNAGLGQYIGDKGAAADATPEKMTPDQVRDWLAQDAAVLPSLAAGKLPAQTPLIGVGTPPVTNLSPAISIDDAQKDSTAPAKGEASKLALAQSSRPAPEAKIVETPAQRQKRLLGELAATLRRQVRQSETPLRQYAALAALDLLEPGLAPDPSSIPTLTPREIELLSDWRELFRRVNEELSTDADDAGALARAVAELDQRMSEWQTLDIATVRLSSSVKGFGQYTPLPGAKMLAGRSNPVIVYVEVEHMTHRASSGPDGQPGYLVELTQELSLYHDSDGLLAWRQPEQEVKDFSSRRRRDFFIVQRIDLPPTLSVGSYRLKITMRDKATGAVAERTIPIELVADAALVRAQ